MKQKITLSLEPDIIDKLQNYADATMQSKSRAVSMLVLQAIQGQGVDASDQQRQRTQTQCIR